MKHLFLRIAFVAIGVILLLTVAYKWLNTSFDSLAVAKSHYQEAPTPIDRSAENQTPVFIEGFTAYREQNWEEAITALDEVDVSNPSYSEARYFLGHAYYQHGQYEKAATVFQILALTRDVRFEEDADWYRVICLLAAQADQSSLLIALQPILAKENHAYYQEALQLRGKIRGFAWRLANGTTN